MSALIKIYRWLESRLAEFGYVTRVEWRRRVTIPLARWLRTVPKDEFDPSLDLDVPAMLRMTEKERRIYDQDLARRRYRAHERDLDSH